MNREEKLLHELHEAIDNKYADFKSKLWAKGMPPGSSVEVGTDRNKMVIIGLQPDKSEAWRRHAFGSDVKIYLSSMNRSRNTISAASTGEFKPGIDQAPTHRAKVMAWAIDNFADITELLADYCKEVKDLEEKCRMRIESELDD